MYPVPVIKPAHSQDGSRFVTRSNELAIPSQMFATAPEKHIEVIDSTRYRIESSPAGKPEARSQKPTRSLSSTDTSSKIGLAGVVILH